jgi:hypothetical protein
MSCCGKLAVEVSIMENDRELLKSKAAEDKQNSAIQGIALTIQFPSDEEVTELTHRIIEEDRELLKRLAE